MTMITRSMEMAVHHDVELKRTGSVSMRKRNALQSITMGSSQVQNNVMMEMIKQMMDVHRMV